MFIARLLRFLPLLALVCAAQTTAAHAATITYLVNGTFESGATISGEFTLDSATATVSAWNIVTSADAQYPGHTYSNLLPNSTASFQGNNSSVPDDFAVLFLDLNDPETFVFFWLAGTPSTFTGGALQPLGASCVPGECSRAAELEFESRNDRRFLTGGTVAAVPEPAMLLLFGAGLAGGVVRRRRG